MKTIFRNAIVAAAVLVLSSAPFSARAQGTAFNYQGRLNDASAGGPANGFYDFQFSLFDAPSDGTQVGMSLTNLATGVTNGLFTVSLDFGAGIFTGSNLWLRIGVRANGNDTFTYLNPMQPLLASPYAVMAGNSANFKGAVADSQLSPNVAMLNANQTFSGAVDFSGQSNSFTGNFSGGGSGLTNVQISALDGQLSAVAAWGQNTSFQTNVPAGLNASNVVAISGGAFHSLALTSAGTVVAWGNNGNGQTNVPGGLGGVIAISAGYNHSLALKSDGTVVGWGDNYYGESTTPAGLNKVVAIAAGWQFSLALKSDGTVAAWGENKTANIPGNFQSNVVAIAASGFNTDCLALKANGSVVAWNGPSAPGGLTNAVAIAVTGNGSGLALKSDGTLVNWGGLAPPPVTNNIVEISAGYLFAVALKNDGTVIGWGDNSANQTNPPLGLSNVVALSAGGYHVLALHGTGLYSPAHLALLDQVNVFTGVGSFNNPNNSFSGNGLGLNNLQVGSLVNQPDSVAAWGYDGYLQTNLPLILNTNYAIAIAAGYYHSLAVMSDGSVIAWGNNSDHQTNVPAGLNGVIAVAAGYYHSLALKSDGTVVAWGDNISQGATNVPVGLNNVVAIAAGQYTSMALKSDGTVVVWGNPSLTNVPSAFQSNLVAIAAFGPYTLGLKNNGTVLSWNASTPPFGLTNVVAIAVTGNGGGLALKSDGTVVNWNSLGTPPATNNIAAISAGYDFGLAIKNDGTVLEWGDPNYGLAAYAANLSGVVAIACGDDHALALRGSGTYSPARIAGLNQVNDFTGINSFNNTNNSFAGIGAGLMSLNASSLSSGTVADARLSTNVALLNASQAFSGANTFGNLSNVFAGDGGGLTNLNASALVSGTVPPAQLPTIVLTNGATNVVLNGAFTGDGSGLTNLAPTAINGGLTTNIVVSVPGGGTMTLYFTNGLLMNAQ